MMLLRSKISHLQEKLSQRLVDKLARLGEMNEALPQFELCMRVIHLLDRIVRNHRSGCSLHVKKLHLNVANHDGDVARKSIKVRPYLLNFFGSIEPDLVLLEHQRTIKLWFRKQLVGISTQNERREPHSHEESSSAPFNPLFLVFTIEVNLLHRSLVVQFRSTENNARADECEHCRNERLKIFCDLVFDRNWTGNHKRRRNSSRQHQGNDGGQSGQARRWHTPTLARTRRLVERGLA